ncbi:MAG: hypothetical protein JWO03_2800 [Bacteroidetes bacterium]|nr:hypothetical protein [Bacteroidota bacterium]
MKVGIIAEGWDDCGVICNIVTKLVPIDSSDDIKFIRPKEDATDGDDDAFSNWNIVRQECIDKTEVDKFFSLFPNEDKLLIVHIDTAECEDYGIARPLKENADLENYSTGLRNLVIGQITNWLGTIPNCNVTHAIAIEEIEAWVIALLDDSLRLDTSSINDPKNQLAIRLKTFMNSKSLKLYKSLKSNNGAFESSIFLSGRLTRKKDRQKAEDYNHSLYLFCEELRRLFP